MATTLAASGSSPLRQYFENVSPITGKTFCEIPRSNAKDIEAALDAAHAAKDAWGHTSAAERAPS